MDEIWKDVDNTSGRYRISSSGNLMKKNINGYIIVKPTLDRYGYQYVNIKYDNLQKAKRVSIHRLVAIAFINNPYNLPIVHHIDENKLNNAVSNLFWCTYAQNHSFALSARNGFLEKHRVIEQYTLDGKYLKTWSSFSEAYRAIRPQKNVTSLISDCCYGKHGRKQAYGYKWRFGKGDPMYELSNDITNTNLKELFIIACEKSAKRVEEALLQIINE